MSTMSELIDRQYLDTLTPSEQVYRQEHQGSCTNSVDSSPTRYTYQYHSNGSGSKAIMNDSDKTIYNCLGSNSSPAGKLTYMEFNLNRGWQKRGQMWKSGPKPDWYSVWKKRVFVLKGNFVYYLPSQEKMEDSKVLGAIYLKNSVIERVSLPMAKYVLKITPMVPRRPSSPDDDTAIFHLKFKSEEGRQEWFEELQQVALNREERHSPVDSTRAYR